MMQDEYNFLKQIERSKNIPDIKYNKKEYDMTEDYEDEEE